MNNEVKQPRILIVEDNEHTQTLYKKVLERAGYKDFVFLDSADAAILSIEKQHPDLLITDYNLKGLNGLQLIKTIREKNSLSDLKIIVVSVESKQIFEQVQSELKIEAIISKPIEIDTLVEKIRSSLEN